VAGAASAAPEPAWTVRSQLRPGDIGAIVQLHGRVYGNEGLGRRLLGDALAFCRTTARRSVYLLTAAGLDAAAHLYRDAGFELVSESSDTRWGGTIVDQRYELRLHDGDAAAPT
jgi:GNAT superfamily N-acetyltransferase